jgi:hypothetical protein
MLHKIGRTQVFYWGRNINPDTVVPENKERKKGQHTHNEQARSHGKPLIRSVLVQISEKDTPSPPYEEQI